MPKPEQKDKPEQTGKPAQTQTKASQRRECPTPRGKLLAIGGSESKERSPKPDSNQENNSNFESLQILKRFCQELRGENPMVAIFPVASSIPEEMGQDYREVFRKLGIKRVEILDMRSRQDAADPRYLEILERAAGFLFTGGDQLRLTSILGGTRLMERLKERYTDDEIIIAGTSAGAAALSTPMIYTGQSDGGFKKGDVYITTGLEFMRDVAIDTHFIARGRIWRMAQAIATNPQCIGIGLEEDTAILFSEGNHLEVVGSGLIVVVDGKGMSHTNVTEVDPGVPVTIRDLRVHMLGKGDRYTLPTQDQQHK
jgi:cyanophycinase